MRKSIIGLLVLLILLVGCSSNNGNADGGGSGKFVVGMECGYPPYNWTQSSESEGAFPLEGGQYCDGYDVQIARIIADKLGKELEIKKIKWEGLILSLQLGEIDAIIAGMSPTDERKKEISFSDVYYSDSVGFGVVVRKDSNYANAKNVNDFSGARLTAQVGTFHVELIEQLPGVDVAEFMLDFPTMTMATQSGNLDGFIADSGTGRSVNENTSDLVYIELTGDGGFEIKDYMVGVGIGIKKENEELLQQVNEALATISKEQQNELMDAAVMGSPSE